jgi:hypothetical protein
MVAIALNVADPAILQVNLDAASAGAHVACREGGPVGARLTQIQRRLAAWLSVRGVGHFAFSGFPFIWSED